MTGSPCRSTRSWPAAEPGGPGDSNNERAHPGRFGAPGRRGATAVGGGGQPKAGADDERVTIERDLYRLVVTSAGGRLESFRLNAYREDSSAESPALEMVDSGDVLPLGVYWTRPDGVVVSDQGLSYAVRVSEEPDGRFSIDLDMSASALIRCARSLRVLLMLSWTRMLLRDVLLIWMS